MMRYTHIAFLFVAFFLSCRQGSHEGHEQHVHGDVSQPVTASPSDIVASAQGTVKPSLLNSPGRSMLNGYILADERRNNTVSARTGGRIEKLYAKLNYQLIKKGSAVMELYSPELNTAAEEYAVLLKSNADKQLLSSSREKLLLLGLTVEQINNIGKSGKAPRTFTVFSMYDGYLFPRDGTMPQQSENTSNSNQGMSMNSMSSTKPAGESYPSTVIREGAYVNKGQALFTVNDMKQVWGIVSIDAGTNVKAGDSITVHASNEAVKAVIGFIEPFYQQGQKFSRARIYLDNTHGKYKLNDLFTAELINPSLSTLSVPSKSILDLGQRKIVWVKTGKAGNNNLFKARTVTTGRTADGYTEIVSGLDANEEIAETAGFMVDSESLIEK